MAGVWPELIVVLFVFSLAPSPAEAFVASTELPRTFEDPTVVLDMLLWRALKTKHPPFELPTLLHEVQMEVSGKLKCGSFPRFETQPVLRSIRDICGDISLHYIVRAETITQDWFSISSPYKDWPLAIGVRAFNLPFSYGCSESFMKLGDRVYCGVMQPWTVYTHRSTINVLLQFHSPEPWGVVLIHMEFQAYNLRYVSPDHSIPSTVELMEEVCDAVCSPVPREASISLPTSQFYIIHNGEIMYEFKVRALYDRVVLIEVESVAENTVTVHDGPDSNCPRANIHADYWVTTAFYAYITVTQRVFDSAVVITHRSVELSESPLASAANHMCEPGIIEARKSKTKMSIASNRDAPIPQLCILNLKTSSLGSRVHVRIPKLNMKTGPGCSTAGVVFIDPQAPRYDSRPVCSAAGTLRYTSRGEKLKLVFYSFLPEQFRVLLTAEKTDCIGVNTECSQLLAASLYYPAMQKAIVPLSTCAHLFILPNAPETSGCDIEVSPGGGRSAAFSLNTYFPVASNESDAISIKLYPPTTALFGAQLTVTSSTLFGQSQQVFTVSKLEMNLTTLSNYTQGGFFLDIEMQECVEMHLDKRNLRYTETSVEPFLFYSCGTIAVALQHHEAKFFILYLSTHHFDVTVELTDTPCSQPVAMNITDGDSHKRPISAWKDLAPRVRWKSSGPFLQVALSMGLNETCGLNFTFQSLRSEKVTYFPSRDACEIQSPVPLPGKDQRITYTLRTPDVSSWEEAERDCARRGAALFSPYTPRRLGQVLTVADLARVSMAPPCRSLANSLWEAPATFIGLRRTKDGNTRWQGRRSVHSMHWWHHNYNSSLYPDILFNSAYYAPHTVTFYEALLSRKFSLAALTAAQKEPAKTALSAEKACTLLVAYTANQAPLWLPVSCSQRLSIPYLCEKTTSSSSFTELQKSLEVQCPKEYQLFEGACYKLYSIPSDDSFWAGFWFCGQDGANVGTDKKSLKPLFKMWNYDKDVHGTIWGLHKGETSAHVLCVSNITSTSKSCASGFFECADKSCILNLYVCDGHADCKEAEDEHECYNYEPTMAKTFYYSCPSHYGSSISVSLLCNGRDDCDQGEDEDKALCANHAFCSANQGRCDGVLDCLDGHDEDGCDYCAGFNCLGSACINVGKVHISPGWCRPSVFGVPSEVCVGRDVASCSTEDAHCFPRSQACLLQHDRWGGVLHCPTGAHLINCERVECPQRFKCHRSYCLQMSKVCDGTKDCVNGEDESFCDDEERCAGLVRCRLSSLCLTQEQVCDGHSDCPHGDDEELCTSSWCPEGCSCTAHVLHCPHRWMHYLPFTVPPNLVSLQLKGNLIRLYGFGKILRRFQSLLILDMSYNIIIMMPHPIVHSPVVRLSLEGNKLRYVTDRAFAGMPYLQNLNLKGNYLGWISANAFSQMHSLPELVLTGLNIVHMAPYCIADMPSLLSVNVSSNKIRYLLGNVFSGAKRLQVIDLTNNPLIYIYDSITAGAWYLENIYMPEFKLCCLLQESISEHISCFPETDPTNVFSTCEDLLSYPILRGSIWIFGVSGILINLFSVVWRRHTQKHSPFSLLVQHLGGADCLMGLYLLMIGAADAKYRNKYYLQEEDWRKSPHCKIAGFTSMLSCEMSIFLLVVITIDRVMAAGLGRKGIGRKTVRSVLMCGWLVWITLSTLPIVGMSYFGGHEYIKHGTCYLFNLSEGKTKGWEFTTAIFVTFNSFCLIFMIVGYSFVFISIQCKTGEMTPTKALARRLSAVIATNCVCWIPPIACGVVALSGHTVHPEIITWISVLVLPINSTVNPFLYTFSISRSVRCHKQRERRDSEDGEDIQQDVLNEEPEPSTSAESHVAHAGARPKTTVFKVSDTLI